MEKSPGEKLRLLWLREEDRDRSGGFSQRWEKNNFGVLGGENKGRWRGDLRVESARETEQGNGRGSVLGKNEIALEMESTASRRGGTQRCLRKNGEGGVSGKVPLGQSALLGRVLLSVIGEDGKMKRGEPLGDLVLSERLEMGREISGLGKRRGRPRAERRPREDGKKPRADNPRRRRKYGGWD